jgi:DNA ligase (NAD+)
LLNAVENTKGSELHRVINALGIEHIGEVASKQICLEFGLEVTSIDYDSLVALDGIGEQMANSFTEFMRVNSELVAKLIETIKPKIEQKIEVDENAFKGKTMVLTGTMSVSRGDIKKKLEALGAKISSSVSKKTDYVVFGEDAGSKYDKALELGVNVLTEDEMNAMI